MDDIDISRDEHDMRFISKDSRAEELILELLLMDYNPDEVSTFMSYLDARESGEPN